MFTWLSGKKTYIVGIVMMLYGLLFLGWQNGDWTSAWEMILAGLAACGLRAGVSKTTTTPQ